MATENAIETAEMTPHHHIQETNHIAPGRHPFKSLQDQSLQDQAHGGIRHPQATLHGNNQILSM